MLAFRRQTKNPRKMVVKTVSNIKSILRRLWGGFGDGFGEDFGGLGRSWGGNLEARGGKKGAEREERREGEALRVQGSTRKRRNGIVFLCTTLPSLAGERV